MTGGGEAAFEFAGFGEDGRDGKDFDVGLAGAGDSEGSLPGAKGGRACAAVPQTIPAAAIRNIARKRITRMPFESAPVAITISETITETPIRGSAPPHVFHHPNAATLKIADCGYRRP